MRSPLAPALDPDGIDGRSNTPTLTNQPSLRSESPDQLVWDILELLPAAIYTTDAEGRIAMGIVPRSRSSMPGAVETSPPAGRSTPATPPASGPSGPGGATARGAGLPSLPPPQAFE